tara:strand:+ start:1265 stop:1603 length:339 start_codon:yes stop_codon:yes gene_type:complete
LFIWQALRHVEQISSTASTPTARRPAGQTADHAQPLQPHQGPTGDPGLNARDPRERRHPRSLPAIFPDYPVPVVRTAEDGERELVMMRREIPGPKPLGEHPITNIRNTRSPH